MQYYLSEIINFSTEANLYMIKIKEVFKIIKKYNKANYNKDIKL